jgi:hypothetical protein
MYTIDLQQVAGRRPGSARHWDTGAVLLGLVVLCTTSVDCPKHYGADWMTWTAQPPEPEVLQVEFIIVE